MDITSEHNDIYEDDVQRIIKGIKDDDKKNDEEIARIFQSKFTSNNSDSEFSNLDTISINTSPSSERYYSFSNSSSSDNVSCFKIGDHIREKLNSSISSCDGEQEKVCPKWAKFFLKTCFCVDDEE